MQSLGDGGGPGGGALPDLALRERRFGFGEGLDDALRLGLRRGRHRPPEPQGWPFAVIGEFDLDIVEPGGSAMLDGHDDLSVAPSQVEIAVSPGMQLAAPPECLLVAPLLRAWWTSRTLEAALQVAQEAEDGGDLAGGILVDATQADQGIEDQQARFDALDGLQQPVGAMVGGWARR